MSRRKKPTPPPPTEWVDILVDAIKADPRSVKRIAYDAGVDDGGLYRLVNSDPDNPRRNIQVQTAQRVFEVLGYSLNHPSPNDLAVKGK